MIHRTPALNLTGCPIPAPAFGRKHGKLQMLKAIALLCAVSFTLAACHSYHIDSTIENRTGSDVQLLEVDYPSASFGADRIAAGASFHYRFQVRGSGPLKVQYIDANGKQIQATGPTLSEGQQGQLQILLLPGAKVEFLPKLAPSG